MKPYLILSVMLNPQKQNTNQNPNHTIEKFALAMLVEQRRKRRWGIFFKLITLCIVLLFVWGFFPWDSISVSHYSVLYSGKDEKTQIARITLFGEINAETGVTAENTIAALDTAADDPKTLAIILDINSPGGSPVQASYIYNEMRRLQVRHPALEIDAVCEDACASAAYYIASASKNIYANPTSLIGSIGVLMDSFGFVDSLQKIGATRRLYTAGKYKGLLDPFSPIHPDSLAFVQGMLDSDHTIFIHDVQAGRGKRLANNPNLFTGLIWNGVQAKPLGLIDGFGSLADVARNRYHSDEIVDFTVKKSIFQKIFKQFNASFWHQFKMTFLSATLH